VVADYAGRKGRCFPSYEQLMERTGYASKHTITDALKHWRDVGVLTWDKGWGNLHGKRANSYQFHEDAMKRQIGAQKAYRDESALSADESALSVDESALTPVSECNDRTLTSHLSTSHISNVPFSTTSPFSLGASEAFHSNSPTPLTAESAPREGPLREESAINALSSVSSRDELSKRFREFCG